MRGKPENFFVPENETKEYNFAEGLKELERRIAEKLAEKDFVVVAFNATGINVGKSFVSSQLARDLRASGVPSLVCGDLSVIDGWTEVFLHDLKNSDRKKGVIILEAQFGNLSTYQKDVGKLRKVFDEEIKNKIGQELSVDKIDILVGLCRPDKPFNTEDVKGRPALPFADFIINNELAIDDPRKK